jgi:hypothetical protein
MIQHFELFQCLSSLPDLIRHGKNGQSTQQTNQASTNNKHAEAHGHNTKQQNANAMHNSYPPAVGVPAKGLAVERECIQVIRSRYVRRLMLSCHTYSATYYRPDGVSRLSKGG